MPLGIGNHILPVFTLRRICWSCQVAQVERICCTPGKEPVKLETKTLGPKLCPAHIILWCRCDWLANANDQATESVSMKNCLHGMSVWLGLCSLCICPKYKIVGMHVLQICCLVDLLCLSRPASFGVNTCQSLHEALTGGKNPTLPHFPCPSPHHLRRRELEGSVAHL